MRRRSLLAASLVALTGCGSSSNGDPPRESETETLALNGEGETRTPTPRATSPPEATAALPPDALVVDYTDLSATQREAFERAQSEPIRFSSGVPGLEEPIHYGIGVGRPFYEYDFVRRDGTYYRTRIEQHGPIGGTRFVVEPVDGDAETDVTLDDRTGNAADLLRQAIETDGDAASIHADAPDWVSTDDVVSYRGEQYRVTQISTRDYAYITLRVSVTFDRTATPHS